MITYLLTEAFLVQGYALSRWLLQMKVLQLSSILCCINLYDTISLSDKYCLSFYDETVSALFLLGYNGQCGGKATKKKKKNTGLRVDGPAK